MGICAYMHWENWKRAGICAGSPPDTSVGAHPTLTANCRFCVQLAGVSWMKTKTISWWKRKLMGAPLYCRAEGAPLYPSKNPRCSRTRLRRESQRSGAWEEFEWKCPQRDGHVNWWTYWKAVARIAGCLLCREPS